MRNIIWRLFLLGVAGAIAIVVAGFAYQVHPFFDTLIHFRLHLSVGLILAALILLSKRMLVFAFAAVAVAILGITYAASGTPFTAKILTPKSNQPVYQLFHLNLFWINKQKASVIDRILEIDPQIVSVVEVSRSWKSHLKKLEANWPHSAYCPEWSRRGGVKIYSKWELNNSSEFCGVYGSLLLTNIIADNGKTFTLGNAHPRWPWPASGPRQIATHVPQLKKIGSDAMVVGDFNATTWSGSIQKFSEAGGLQVFEGIGATWFFGTLPAWIIRVIGLPIDNVMSKGNVSVLSAETLEAMGSDHLPLLVRFQLN